MKLAGGLGLLVLASLVGWYACLVTVAAAGILTSGPTVGGRVVVSVMPTAGAVLEPADVAALARALPDMQLGRAVVPRRAAFTDSSPSVPVQSVDAEFFKVYAWTTVAGALFTPGDDVRSSPVVVLGSQAAHALFTDSASPVGRTVRIQQVAFTVVGVLSPSDDPSLRTFDNSAFVPLQTGRVRLVGMQAPTEILIGAADPSEAAQVATTASQVLTARYRAEVPFDVETRASSANNPPVLQQLLAQAADRVRAEFLHGKGFA